MSQLISHDIKNVTKRLTKHMNNKEYYRIQTEPTFQDGNIPKDFEFEGKNLRELNFKNCTFENISCTKTGFSGSIFYKCNFYITLPMTKEMMYNDTNFSSCYFIEGNFKDLCLNNTRFNESIFTDTNFKNCTFDSVSMTGCKFINCSFENCIWDSLYLENAIFKNCHINSTKFKKMNFEFVTFDNIELENVILPFPTIPFIFGGLQYLISNKDNTDKKISISSATTKKGISIEEYLLNIPDLIAYYTEKKSFFPLIILKLATQASNDANEIQNLLEEGLLATIKNSQFRMIKNYCKLINFIPIEKPSFKQELYFKVIKEIQSFNHIQKEIFSPEISALQNSLLGSTNLSTTIYFETDIEHTQIEKIATLYQAIDNALDKKCYYKIQLMHNSPIAAFIEISTFISENPVEIFQSLEAIFNKGLVVLAGAYYLSEAVAKAKNIAENGDSSPNYPLNEAEQELQSNNKKLGISFKNIAVNINPTINITVNSNNSKDA
ncbi:MAG: hypothetical protein ATN36_06750 [Epulopiscium sp. Nele67-Bin005]|nr:MAG: hypothetical protein ATN36_06750 [Epulopiscium sp. Nele67-Bin005]